jgi:ankyrin repeat protein
MKDYIAILGDREGDNKAMWAGKIDIAKLLIENGADINAKRKDGKTPLDLAYEIPDRDVRDKIIKIFTKYSSR